MYYIFIFALLLPLIPTAYAQQQIVVLEEEPQTAAGEAAAPAKTAEPASATGSTDDSLSLEALRELQQALQKERDQQQQAADDDAPEAGKDAVVSGNIAILRGLNKITGHTQILEAPVNKPIPFGNLEIIVHSCWKSVPSQHKEAKALLEILEQKPNESKKRIFYGWMFSTSPSLSALEDPVNDVVVKDCK